MKKLRTIVYTAGIMAIAALAMVSCSKEESAQAGAPDRTGTISVSVSGLMGEYTQNDDTKAELISNVRVSWEAGNKVYAFDGKKCLGELNVSLKDSKDYYALLTGELLEPASGTTKITLVYASGYSATQGQTITDGKLSFDISSQSSGSDSNDSPFVVFGTLDYTEGTPSLEEEIVDFSLATSVMRLNCTGLEASAAITGATLIGMSNECVLNVTNTGTTVGQGAIGDISLSFADGFKASASGAQVIYAGIAKNGTESAQTLEVNQSKTYEWSFGSKTRAIGKSINAICQMKEKVLYYFTVSDKEEAPYDDIKKIIFAQGNLYCTRTGSEGNWTYSFAIEENQWDYRGICIDGYNYYDASFNKVAKNKITSTFPGVIYEENTSGLFQWISASCTGTGAEEARKNFGAFSSLSNEQSYQGVSDADILDFGKALGEGSPWRTLTYNEWEYLIEVRKVKGNTSYGNTCAWATLENGVKGLIIFHDNYTGATTGLTSIPEGCAFLPAAGSRGKTNDGEYRVQSMGGYGNYWSSTAYDSWCPQALYLYFYSGNGFTFYSTRDAGLSVRLVSYIE